MYFRQFRVPDMGCASYMVGSQGECAVIDPQWHIEPYLRVAKKEGLKITHIIDTHLHADHVSGNRRLAAQTGAQLHLSNQAHPNFNISPLHDGEALQIGQVQIDIMHTPGHTPESIILKVSDLAQPEAPPYLLTGDTIFVGDVGRPDLAGKEGAAQLFSSLKQLLPKLPGASPLYPAHLAGSLCGRNMSPAHSSTLEEELKSNPALQIQHQEEFIHYLTDDLPEHPADFERIINLNREGPPLELTELRQLNPHQAKKLVEAGGSLVDLRDPEVFWHNHIFPSLNIPVYSNQFGPNVINFIPPTSAPVLIAEDEIDAAEAVKLLAGVGRLNVAGFVLAEEALESGEFQLNKTPLISAQEIGSQPNQPLLDVREPQEYAGDTALPALNIPFRKVNRTESIEKTRNLLGKENFLVVICDNGNRSSIAASYLEQQGIACRNLGGGLAAWKKMRGEK